MPELTLISGIQDLWCKTLTTPFLRIKDSLPSTAPLAQLADGLRPENTPFDRREAGGPPWEVIIHL